MAEFEVVRSTTIDAPAERIQALIEDFRAWRDWSPWEDLDPNLRRDYSGAERGPGARYAWAGNRKAGRGRMEIISSSPERVELELVFEMPWKATNRVLFELAGGDGATGVTWRMRGEQRGLAALFARVFSMDRMVGPDFERGLARLKARAEAGL